MKQILLVPDSFKGTLTSRQVCETMAEQLHLVFPEADITSLPVADGGEGSVEAFLAAAGGERVEKKLEYLVKDIKTEKAQGET